MRRRGDDLSSEGNYKEGGIGVCLEKNPTRPIN